MTFGIETKKVSFASVRWMMRRFNESQWESVVDERLGVESEIIDAPTTSVADIVVKLEIIAKESEIFGDVSERLNQLRDQIAKFADGNVIRLIGRDD